MSCALQLSWTCWQSSWITNCYPVCFTALCLLFDLDFTYMSLPSQGSVSFSSGIPSSDLSMSPVSGCLSSDAVSSHSCKLSYLGISCAPGENVNPPSSQGSQSLPCALLACLSSNHCVSPGKLAHFGLCPALSGNINPAHIGDTVYRFVACTL